MRNYKHPDPSYYYYYQYLPQVRAIGRWGMYKKIGLFSLPSLVLLLFAHFGAWN